MNTNAVNAGARIPEVEALLTSGEVASMFRVDRSTVVRWARSGKFTSVRTLGGHRRFRAAEVFASLTASRSRLAADSDVRLSRTERKHHPTKPVETPH